MRVGLRFGFMRSQEYRNKHGVPGRLSTALRTMPANARFMIGFVEASRVQNRNDGYPQMALDCPSSEHILAALTGTSHASINRPIVKL